MEKVSQVYELQKLTPQYEYSTISAKAFNFEKGGPDIHIISFLDLALTISPDGKGKVLIPMPYDSSDKDTGPSEDVIFHEMNVSDFIETHFGKDRIETTLIENAVIEILEIRDLNKNDLITSKKLQSC